MIPKCQTKMIPKCPTKMIPKFSIGRGSTSLACYEPFIPNYNLAHYNLAGFGCKLYQKAVVADDVGEQEVRVMCVSHRFTAYVLFGYEAHVITHFTGAQIWCLGHQINGMSRSLL